MAVARGIRNNNPGNIRLSKDKWQGLAVDQTDKEFFVFKDPVYGIRALARILIKYQDSYGLRTVRDIIYRWAPPSENDTAAYCTAVCQEMGVGAVDQLDMHYHGDLKGLTKCIIRHECGSQPYSDAQIDKGLLLAGVEAPKKSLRRSRQIAGNSTAATGVVALAAVVEVKDQIEPLIAYFDTLKWIFVGLALAGVALAAYAKWDERRKGIS